MSRKIHAFTIPAVIGFTLLILVSVPIVYGFVPPPWRCIAIRYINTSYSYEFWTSPMEDYVKNALPNEWIPGWGSDTLQAGAVIIRSWMYWRINRTDLDSPYPNNNCDGGFFCFDPGCQYFTKYNITAPASRGGKEEWNPNTSQPSTNAAVDATFQYHTETLNLISGRPDKLIALRYNSTIQNRTNQTTGSWLNRIWYAYTGSGYPGSPYNPNAQCNQTDTWTPTSDPVFPNN